MYYKNLTTGLVWKIVDKTTLARIANDANYVQINVPVKPVKAEKVPEAVEEPQKVEKIVKKPVKKKSATTKKKS